MHIIMYTKIRKYAKKKYEKQNSLLWAKNVERKKNTMQIIIIQY